jgi:metacaspase-1
MRALGRIFFNVVVTGAAGLLASSAAAEDRALFIGVTMNVSPVPTLPGIDKDVALVKEAAGTLGFKPGQIKIVMGADATKAGIVNAIEEWLVKGVGPKDRALFYYSGHGTRIRDRDGDESDGMDEALVPADVAKGERGWENVLLDDEFGPLLRKIPAREVVAFIDACHSGTLTRSLAADAISKFAVLEEFDEATMGKALEDGAVADGEISKSLETNVVIVSAANETQAARATPLGSVFTLGLRDVLEAARKGNQPLTPNDVRDATEAYIAKKFASRPQLVHTPTVDGNPKLAAADLFSGPVAPLPAATAAPTASPSPAPRAMAAAPAAPRPTAAAPRPTTAPRTAAADGPAWKQLEEVTRQAKYKLTVRPGAATYRVGQTLSLKIDVPQDGYLNVLNVGAGEDKPVVLFPNEYRPDNAVKAGAQIEIPGPGAPFTLPASLPAGAGEQRALVIVALSKKPLNAFKSTSGTGFLRELSPGATRAFTVEAASPDAGGYGAGQVVVVIRK